MKIWTILLLSATCTSTGCALWANPQQPTIAVETAQPATEPLADGDTEFGESETAGEFAKSEFIANDFISVIVRIPAYEAGKSSFSAWLPRTRFGEILMEQLRQTGYRIVLGPGSGIPELSYQVETPTENGQNVYTFLVSIADTHLKRSYEIVGDRIAPVSEMLMAGVDVESLRPLESARSNDEFTAVSTRSSSDDPEPGVDVAANKEVLSDLKVSYLNELLLKDEDWNPLEPNMYESRTSVYDPVFADSTIDYEQMSMQVLVFPNDSLVLGNTNKQYLRQLAEEVKTTGDIVRVIGCSHGKTELVDGNPKLARGRAVRVREELMLSGVEGASVLHEACWANVHFDEMMPRRGVVVMRLRERS